MSLAFLDNVDYKGKKPNFSRDMFDTMADMKAFSDNYLPDTFIATCVETGKAYLYNKSNTVDTITGKWRELGSGASPEPSPAPTPVKGKYYYSGTSATPTVTDLSTLTKGTLSLAETTIECSCLGDYLVIAVPSAGGAIKIFDENGLNNTDSFIKSVVNDGTEDYDVYVSDNQVFFTNFKYTIKY